MIKYLSETQVRMLLRSHRSVEQWLGNYFSEKQPIIQFVTLHNDKRDGCYCCYGDFLDTGDHDHCDIYSFYTLDDENEYGITKYFPDIATMLDFCYDELKASPDQFVGNGMLQDVYLDYLETKENKF